MGCCFTFPRASAAAELKAVITSFSIDPLSVPEKTHLTNGILRIITCNNVMERLCKLWHTVYIEEEKPHVSRHKISKYTKNERCTSTHQLELQQQ
jgi:hypothetical protein